MAVELKGTAGSWPVQSISCHICMSVCLCVSPLPCDRSNQWLHVRHHNIYLHIIIYIQPFWRCSLVASYVHTLAKSWTAFQKPLWYNDLDWLLIVFIFFCDQRLPILIQYHDNFKTQEWLKRYGDVKWWISNRIFPSGGVPFKRVGYQLGTLSKSNWFYRDKSGKRNILQRYVYGH